KTLKWIQTHTPEEIAAQLPQDYYAGDKELYLSALKGSMPMFSPDGKMPAGAPDFILKVLQTYNNNVKGKTIDLTKTWTNEFVDAAKSWLGAAGRSPRAGLPRDPGRAGPVRAGRRRGATLATRAAAR